MKKNKVLVLLGPTSVGKTEIALQIASKCNLEIISCDSRQIYKGMDIGTAKSSPGELHSVPHHLIDIITPDQAYSAFQFVEDARDAINKIHNNKRHPFIVGGTGLYFRSLSEGIGPQAPSDPDIRAELMERAEKEGVGQLYKELSVKDPVAATTIHSNDIHRIVRALTVFNQTGQPISSLQKTTQAPEDLEFLVYTMSMQREVLYSRINNRVDTMITNGLTDEFRHLKELGYNKNSPGLQCVGYRELFDVDSTATLKRAIELIKQNTRRYAKRQVTWFTHQTSSITIDNSSNEALLFEQIQRYFGSE